MYNICTRCRENLTIIQDQEDQTKVICRTCYELQHPDAPVWARPQARIEVEKKE